eukprot:m.44251 g.44251  ORF g.44251 m.44251 type:complete len:341 (-) comp19635_c0_seq1:45-1067(-)
MTPSLSSVAMIMGFVVGTQSQRIPQYHQKILDQSYTTLCEPIFDGELTCPPKQILTIPRDIPDSVTYIDVDNNYIGADPEALTGAHILSGLLVLKLNRNQITSIHPGVFTAFKTLKRLELRGNFLTTISSQYFGSIAELAILMLQNNRIQTIQTGAFSELRQLQSLHLEKNEVTGISPRSWPRYPSLLKRVMMGTNPSNCSISHGDYVRCDCCQGHGGEDGTYCVYGGRVVTSSTSLVEVARMLSSMGHGTGAESAMILAKSWLESERSVSGGIGVVEGQANSTIDDESPRKFEMYLLLGSWAFVFLVAGVVVVLTSKYLHNNNDKNNKLAQKPCAVLLP